MTGYVVRRLLYVIPLVLGVALIVSLIFNSGLFGDPAQTMLGKHATADAIEKLREDMGLNKAWYEQYWDYLQSLWTLDFGRSHQYKVRISEMLVRGAVPSLTITLPAFAIATTIAVSLSLLCAAFRGKAIDRSILVAAVGLMSVSSLVYIIFGQYFLAHKLDIGLPVQGYERGPGALRFVILPIIIFVFLTIGPDLRFYRTAMLEEIKQDYVRTARAKGVSERVVLFRHVLRNGMIPILTRVVVELPFLFLGSLLLERFFSIPGLGGMTITGVLTNDLPVLRAMTFIFAVLLVVGNLLTDIAYTIVDPRVRLG
jgi:peptide/nickel transport system permease protein